MKKYIVIFLFLIPLIYGVVTYLLPNYETNGPVVAYEEPDPVSIEYPEKNGSATKQKALIEQLDDAVKTNPRIAKMKALVDAARHDILFYGKIIDQNDQPVPGAIIKFSTGAPYGFGNTKRYRTSSNNQGIFVVKNVGGSNLLVESIKKEGYEVNKEMWAKGSLFWPYVNGSRTQIWTDYTRENPFIYRAWKGKVVTLKTGERKPVYFAPNEKWYTVNFLEHGVRSISEGKNDKGELWVKCYRSPDASRGKQFDWRVTIMVPEGGLIETEELYMNRAPEHGYQQTWTFDYPRDREDWVNRLTEKKFYLKSRGGKIYGKLTMDIIPYFNEKSAIFVSFGLNTNGERNLMAKTD
jgi:hypothetical protein